MLCHSGVVPKTKIPTVGSTIRDILLFGQGPKQRVDILKNLTGRIATRKMTLLMGPPGCGKSSLLKALAGQLHIGCNKFEGALTYNGDSPDSGRFKLPKIVDYIDEKDQHAPTLYVIPLLSSYQVSFRTVWETLEFAWLVSSNGHHSYGVASDEASAQELDKEDPIRAKVRHSIPFADVSLHVHNVLQVLGLAGCADTIVGDGTIRGVSGGQKRRVTVGEMVLPPRVIKFMDAVSNGLDASTTFDIFRSLKYVSRTLGTTICVSLLQVPPALLFPLLISSCCSLRQRSLICLMS